MTTTKKIILTLLAFAVTFALGFTFKSITTKSGNSDQTIKKVTGIGGIFFKAKDAPALQAWYKLHLGIDVQVWGGAAFEWTDADGKLVAGTTSC